MGGKGEGGRGTREESISYHTISAGLEMRFLIFVCIYRISYTLQHVIASTPAFDAAR